MQRGTIHAPQGTYTRSRRPLIFAGNRDETRHHLARQRRWAPRQGATRYKPESTDEQLRDGLIQRFEFTYELSHKMLRRYLKETAASPEEIDRIPFADLIRRILSALVAE